MIKFEYYHQEDKALGIKPNTLYIHQPGEPRQAITKTFTTGWGSPGFILEPNNHWITFTVYPNKIRAFYKCVKTEELETWPADLAWEDKSVSAITLAPVVSEVSYYQKDLELNSQTTNPIIFTFTQADQVHKVHGKWVKKHA